MGRLKGIGGIVFIALLIGGGIYFNDFRKKETAKAEGAAVAYFESLMKEDQSINVTPATGGAPVHPWALVSTPTIKEIDDHVTLPQTFDGTWYAWELHYDAKGAPVPKPIHIRATFNGQGKLESLSGIHGTVTQMSGGWQPE